MSHPLRDLSSLTISDRWVVSQGFLDEKLMIARIRQGLDDIVGHPELSNRLRIVWEFHTVNSSGLPGDGDLQMMEACEDLLTTALEVRNEAIMTHVITCDGLRQWVFYCGDLGVAGDRLNSSLPHQIPFPIDLTAEIDGDWIEYLDLNRTFEPPDGT